MTGGSDLPPTHGLTLTAVIVTHAALLSHTYLSVSCSRVAIQALLLNLE